MSPIYITNLAVIAVIRQWNVKEWLIGDDNIH